MILSPAAYGFSVTDAMKVIKRVHALRTTSSFLVINFMALHKLPRLCR